MHHGVVTGPAQRDRANLKAGIGIGAARIRARVPALYSSEKLARKLRKDDRLAFGGYVGMSFIYGCSSEAAAPEERLQKALEVRFGVPRAAWCGSPETSSGLAISLRQQLGHGQVP